MRVEVLCSRTNPHPDPLPFTKGEGTPRTLTGHETESSSKPVSSPRSERGEDQGEGHSEHLRSSENMICRTEIQRLKHIGARRGAWCSRRSRPSILSGVRL